MDFFYLLIMLFFIIPMAYKINKIYGNFCILYLLYTFFSIYGYINYGSEINRMAYNQYYGVNKSFYIYYFYILGFIVVLTLLLKYLNKIKCFNFRIKVGNKNKKIESVYFIINILFIMILSIFLISNYNRASYFDQRILKSNKLWFFAFNFSIYLIVINFYLGRDKGRKKIFYYILGTIIAIFFLLTALKFGQRIQILNLTFGVITVLLLNIKKSLYKIILKKEIILISLSFISLSQYIRGNRGGIKDLKFEFSMDLITSVFGKTMVFQDYLIPSYTLLTSIEKKIFLPVDVIKSNILNTLIIFNYPTLGSLISRIIEPKASKGYGYFILSEGYNLCGGLGILVLIIYIAFIFKFYFEVLTNTLDKKFNILMSSVISMYLLNIVRSQSLFFLKGILMFYLPAIFMYICATGKKIRLVKK